VIGRGVGRDHENDINLAIAFRRGRPSASTCDRRARRARPLTAKGVDIRYYTVIYQAIDEIEAALKGMLKPESKKCSSVRPRSARCSAFRGSATSPGSLVRTGVIQAQQQGAPGTRRRS